MQQLSIEETPVEKVESTFNFIPNFKFNGDNTEREELNKAFTTGKEASKNLKKSRDGTGGGLKTQSNVRTLKIFVRDFYLESKDLDEDDESKLQFFKEKLEELKEIIMQQKLLTKQFETKK